MDRCLLGPRIIGTLLALGPVCLLALLWMADGRIMCADDGPVAARAALVLRVSVGRTNVVVCRVGELLLCSVGVAVIGLPMTLVTGLRPWSVVLLINGARRGRLNVLVLNVNAVLVTMVAIPLASFVCSVTRIRCRVYLFRLDSAATALLTAELLSILYRLLEYSS